MRRGDGRTFRGRCTWRLAKRPERWRGLLLFPSAPGNCAADSTVGRCGACSPNRHALGNNGGHLTRGGNPGGRDCSVALACSLPTPPARPTFTGQQFCGRATSTSHGGRPNRFETPDIHSEVYASLVDMVLDGPHSARDHWCWARGSPPCQAVPVSDTTSS
jgi:hypothetical protein